MGRATAIRPAAARTAATATGVAVPCRYAASATPKAPVMPRLGAPRTASDRIASISSSTVRRYRCSVAPGSARWSSRTTAGPPSSSPPSPRSASARTLPGRPPSGDRVNLPRRRGRPGRLRSRHGRVLTVRAGPPGRPRRRRRRSRRPRRPARRRPRPACPSALRTGPGTRRPASAARRGARPAREERHLGGPRRVGVPGAVHPGQGPGRVRRGQHPVGERQPQRCRVRREGLLHGGQRRTVHRAPAGVQLGVGDQTDVGEVLRGAGDARVGVRIRVAERPPSSRPG